MPLSQLSLCTCESRLFFFLPNISFNLLVLSFHMRFRCLVSSCLVCARAFGTICRRSTAPATQEARRTRHHKELIKCIIQIRVPIVFSSFIILQLLSRCVPRSQGILSFHLNVRAFFASLLFSCWCFSIVRSTYGMKM